MAVPMIRLHPSESLTYERYLSEEVVRGRYEILDGVRHFMAPTRRHQRIVSNVDAILRGYETATAGAARAYLAPCDLLIQREPLRTRQPDALLIGRERLAENDDETDATPLGPAPELVVEILSASDRPTTLYGKLTDYAAVDVREVWVISPTEESVEVMARDEDGAFATVAVYRRGESARSVVFPDLIAPVDTILAD